MEDLSGAKDESVKERSMEIYKEEERRVKRCVYEKLKERNVQFGEID